jgi:hypothetical protein
MPASRQPPIPVIGLDVGGANTKAAAVDSDATLRIVSEPFELWRDPEGLADAIASVVERLELDGAAVALTTTAELVDVFASKREGVLSVLRAAERALPGRRLRVARSLPDVILLDCGGTTTDVIPIVGGEVAARGRTDVERLLAGELVYTGALRTNIAAVVSSVPIGGEACPVSTELFAISADAHLLRGSLTAEQCTCTFPDDRGTSPAEVRSRLARVVCADPEQLADGDLEAIADAVHDAQVAAIAAGLEQVARRVPAGTGVLAVGVGAFLAGEAAERCGLALHPGSGALDGRAGDVAAAVALSVLGRE